MFTGLIEELGSFISKTRKYPIWKLSFKANKVLAETQLGDSISVNGVCLTVTELSKNSFSVDVMSNTWTGTTLNRFKIGQKVNLERSVKVGDRLGGHIVQGHVDAVAQVKRIIKRRNNIDIDIALPSNIKKQVVKKGSIAVNGISLTVQDVRPNNFVVSIIPHTFLETSLKFLMPGEKVNLETDFLLRAGAT